MGAGLIDICWVPMRGRRVRAARVVRTGKGSRFGVPRAITSAQSMTIPLVKLVKHNYGSKLPQRRCRRIGLANTLDLKPLDVRFPLQIDIHRTPFWMDDEGSVAQLSEN